MLAKKWLYPDMSRASSDLSEVLDLSPFITQILLDRQIDTAEKIKFFLYGTHDDLHSPWLLPDTKKAVDRIVKAINNQEQITIYGDYDVDGQTASTLLIRVLQHLSADPALINYYVPHRMDEGYGLHQEALSMISAASSLVITVDCGISALNESEYAASIGLDLIITDHHEPGPELPKAVAVINPKRPDSQYPFNELAGVGVAYKLVQALGEHYQQEFTQYLDLVALGTVADLVPLVDENRIFVKLGLLQLQKTEIEGLRQLVKVCGLKPPFKASDFGFKLGPRLNAVGRMGESARGIELLLSTSPDEANSLALVLDQENSLRRQTETNIYEEAVRIVEKNGYAQDPVIVVAHDQWHPGVIGIVASRLVEKYYRPTIVIALADGIGKGSARSIKGFDLYEGLTKCKHLLVAYGGHEMAAGLTIESDKIEQLRELLMAEVETKLTAEDFIPKLRIDYSLELDELNHKLLSELKLLEPFGMGHPTPNFAIAGAVLQRRMIGATGEHVRLKIQSSSGDQIEAVGFGMYASIENHAKYYEQLEFAVYPQKGYSNPDQVEVIVRDFHPAPQSENFINRWIVTNYPWDLPINYGQISHVQNQSELLNVDHNFTFEDQRNIWAPENELKKLNRKKRILIYVATPQKALELCRQLRIEIPGGAGFVGFEHELLTIEEREELTHLVKSGEITWVVSTGIWQPEWHWDHVVLYHPFCHENLLKFLGQQSFNPIIALYGKADCRWLQQEINSLYPDRTILAQYYLAMSRTGKQFLSIKELQQIALNLTLEKSLDLALAVFTDLNLIEYQNGKIEIMPKPASKLDLTDSVSYNESVTKREQYLAYLQHCLEGSFFNEFGTKNSGNRRFS